MDKKLFLNRIVRFFKLVYLKLFRINDTPQKIAIGFGLGVFAGVLPGVGPIAALVLAFVFRVNRAAALLGSLLTNTWSSIMVMLLSIQAVAFAMGVDYHDVYQKWNDVVRSIRWSNGLQVSFFKIILPVGAGYLFVSLCAGVIAYGVPIVVMKVIKEKGLLRRIRRNSTHE